MFEIKKLMTFPSDLFCKTSYATVKYLNLMNTKLLANWNSKYCPTISNTQISKNLIKMAISYILTAWKVFKYRVFSGPGWIRSIWTLFTQWLTQFLTTVIFELLHFCWWISKQNFKSSAANIKNGPKEFWDFKVSVCYESL